MKRISLYLVVAIGTFLYSCEKKNISDEKKSISDEKMNIPNATGQLLAVAKKVYIPRDIWNIPTNNDYNNDASLYSNMRRAESEDFVAFWAKDFGATPATQHRSQQKI